MELWKRFRHQSAVYLEESIKWTLMGLVIGVVGGVVGVVFHHGITEANHFRAEYPWLLWCLPVLGLVIVFLYHRLGMRTDRGTNRVLDSVRENEPIPLRVAFLMFVSTILTQLGGGSAGREGAALQIGGSIGSFFSHRVGPKLKLPTQSQKVGVMCGMSAVFSALFGTPLTAAVFSIEVAEVGAMHHLGLLPCIIASFTAFVVAQQFGGEKTVLPMVMEVSPTVDVMVRTVILAFLCALVSILFCVVMHKAGHVYSKVTRNAYVRVVIGGLLVAGLATLMGTTAFNGAGMNLVEDAMEGNVRWYTFLVKMLFTAITLGAGFKGGEIVPSFAIGSTFGCVVAPLLGLDPVLGAALGLVAVFCGVVNCPFASIILGLELCGSHDLVLFAIVSAVSLLFSGSCSLYSSQRILREKFDYPTLDDLSEKM